MKYLSLLSYAFISEEFTDYSDDEDSIISSHWFQQLFTFGNGILSWWGIYSVYIQSALSSAVMFLVELFFVIIFFRFSVFRKKINHTDKDFYPAIAPYLYPIEFVSDKLFLTLVEWMSPMYLCQNYPRTSVPEGIPFIGQESLC